MTTLLSDEFPALCHVKAFGTNHTAFFHTVRAVILEEMPHLPEESFSSRESRGGKYLAVTCSAIFESKDQLQSVYIALKKHPDVVFML